MKRILLILVCLIILAACERPATSSNWSPINDANTPGAAVSATASELMTDNTPEQIMGATSSPTLDLDQFSDPLPESMKGYELVSWQTGDDWNFTLVTGTNRSKTFEELMDPASEVTSDGFVKITVSGIDQVKKVLGMLPINSDVFWGGMSLEGQVPEGTVYFSYPPLAEMNEIADFCARHKINLLNLSEPQ